MGHYMSLVIAAAKKIVEYCNDKSVSELGCYVNGNINIELSNRMTKTWGYATCIKGVYTIRLNSKVFGETHIHTDAFKHLVIHEFCHLLDHVVNKKWGHGRGWKSFMRFFGLKSDVYVTENEKTEVGYVRVKRSITKYEHDCKCRVHAVGGAVHNRIMRGAKYTCKHCKTVLGNTFKTVKS